MKFFLDPLLTIANNKWAIVATYAFTLFVSGGVFALMEHLSYVDGIYWASTTMTTTGYGDVTAHTDAGKIFTIILQTWSVLFVLAITIAYVIDKLIADRNEFSDAEQEQLKADIRQIKEVLGGRD